MPKGKATDTSLTKLEALLDHYSKGIEDMDRRRTRKNGWNDIINAYMSRLPSNWPYTALVTDPRIRTTILEKTARLTNSKLQGRVIPREGGDIVKARIINSILDYQWDAAEAGGAMVEKVAQADQTTRIFGSSYAYVYWDNEKNSNEIKVCDPRDIFIDFSATHIRNAKWVQYREYTSLDALEKQGYDTSTIKKKMRTDKYGDSDLRSANYESQVKLNRGLEDRVGQDVSNPVLEVITEYTPDTCTVFLPRYGEIIKDGKNPYSHNKIPFAQLRYYPLGDDIYGESEVESVIPLQRAINAILCGFVDAMNLSMRPPVKLVSGQYRKETIEYGPGAQWVVNSPNAATEVQTGSSAIQSFNATYPALVAAFNTAMGDQSLGTSNIVGGGFEKKTATEVASLEKQQSQRDQYNQLYLSEFLKDIMMMWISNTQQYLFDDPTKKHYIVKIIGKDNIKSFQAMLLDGQDIPDYALSEISQTIEQNPDAVTDEMMQEVLEGVTVPTNPVITNPNEENPENYDVKSKLTRTNSPDEADLYVTPEDLVGVYDYVPDVKSMASGSGIMQQQARNRAIELALNPQVAQMLQTTGYTLNIKEVLQGTFEDAGYKDAESLFQSISQPNTGGAGGINTGAVPSGNDLNQGMGGVPQAVPDPTGEVGLSQPQGVPI